MYDTSVCANSYDDLPIALINVLKCDSIIDVGAFLCVFEQDFCSL